MVYLLITHLQRHLLLSSFKYNFGEVVLILLLRENWLASAKHLLGSRFGVSIQTYWGVSGPHCSLTIEYIQVSRSKSIIFPDPELRAVGPFEVLALFLL